MSLSFRVISRLDIKGPNLVKGVQLEGLRVLGKPEKFAKYYYEQGTDEIMYQDVVASLYGRNTLEEIVDYSTKNIFIPICVGGGIQSIEMVKNILNSGADKICINSYAVKNPNIIQELSKRFGSQAIVLSVEAKKKENMKWEVYIESGRESTGIDVIDWVKKGAELGAGELLLTSVDMEGTTKGFDIELLKLASNEIKIPVIASGGFGELEDLNLALNAGLDAVSIAHMLHYKKLRLQEIRDYALKLKLDVRKFNQ